MGERSWEYYSYAPGVLLGVCLIALIKSLPHSKNQKMYQMPPGPKGWPILGSLVHLSGVGRDEFLFGLVRQYGGVFSLRLGSQLVVVVNSFRDVMRPLLLDGHVLSERAPIESLDCYFQGRGIAGAKYGSGWEEVRRFTHRIFRSLGVGRRCFEANVLGELDHMFSEVEQRVGRKEGFDPMLLFNNATANVIGSVLYGQRFDRKNAVFEAMKAALHRSLQLIQYGGASTFLPFMRYLPTLPGLKAFYKEMDTAIHCNEIFIKKYLQERENGDQVVTTIVDAYLDEIKQGESSSFSHESLAFVINDLFMAGTETSATVLTWAVLAALVHPQIQERIHQEIDSQVPTSRQITLQDKPNLPYTQAVLLETLRYGSVVPAVMRATTQDTAISDYEVPEGTIVMLNYLYANFDPEVWEDPEEFKPERFLDDEGHLVEREELIPFSIGRRNCLGDSLAKMEIFLFFSNLLKFYRFEPTNESELSMAPQAGLTRVPLPYTVKASSRGHCICSSMEE
ncbi:cytochrome P450 2U1-like [Patiria miniata]|uniref:Cytochrome P450 n=1 Tax=Patiria miniata TaxID=46514 RepID=A0A913ZIA9_PATMI|nr:cytochrome P450 2U1-like [Patiria miniata]